MSVAVNVQVVFLLSQICCFPIGQSKSPGHVQSQCEKALPKGVYQGGVKNWNSYCNQSNTECKQKAQRDYHECHGHCCSGQPCFTLEFVFILLFIHPTFIRGLPCLDSVLEAETNFVLNTVTWQDRIFFVPDSFYFFSHRR